MWTGQSGDRDARTNVLDECTGLGEGRPAIILAGPELIWLPNLDILTLGSHRAPPAQHSQEECQETSSTLEVGWEAGLREGGTGWR